MQKKANLFLLLGAVALFVLVVLFAHQPRYVETEQAMLVDFAALVPADGVVELQNRLSSGAEKQFKAQDALEIVLAVQNTELIPYSGPKHTLAPGGHWSIVCKDLDGNLVFSFLLGSGEVQYYNPNDIESPMYYSLSKEDEAALLLKMEELFIKQE